MADYTRDVKKVLMENGWKFYRHGKGDHDIWTNGTKKTTVDNKIKSRYMANIIFKQASIDFKF